MKKIRKYILFGLLVIVGSFLCFYAFTFAKFVSNSVWNYYLKSKGFYFNSDFLGSIQVKNVNNLWDGKSVHFNIRNNLNEAVITNYDINYIVTCTIEGDAQSYTACHLNGTEQSTQNGVLSSFQMCVNNTGDQVDVSSFNKTECELGGYDWVTQIATQDLYFDVVVTDEQYELMDVVVNITVTSTSPYRKTLRGKFTLHKSDLEEGTITMDYKNYDDYDRLIISNSYSSDKCVSISWDANKLVIDADRNELSSYDTDASDYINKIKINIGGKESLSYIFYKKDFGITYDVDDFLIEEDSGC